MATTTSNKRKLSWTTLLSFVMVVLPAVIEMLNGDSHKATIDLQFDSDKQRLISTVADGTKRSSVSKSFANKS